MHNSKDDSEVITIRTPKADIECERKYPFTYMMNASLRGLRRHYSDMATKQYGRKVDIMFPTVLSKMMFEHLLHLYKTEGFVLTEDDFEDSEQYQKYLKLIQG